MSAVEDTDLRETFLAEASEHLELLDQGLLELRSGRSEPDLLDRLFRAAHSVKGGAGAVHMSAVVRLTHTVEGLLDGLRTAHRPPDDDLIVVLLNAVDQIGELIDLAGSGDLRTPDWLDGAVQALRDARHRRPEQAVAAQNGPRHDWSIRVVPNLDMLLCNDPLPVLELLADEGVLTAEADVSRVPPVEEMVPSDLYLTWALSLLGGPPRDALDELLMIIEDEATIEVTARQPSAASKPDRPKSAAAKISRRQTSIRVHTDRIDQLLDEVGELVIAQAVVADRARSAAGDDRALAASITQLERQVRVLQESVLGMRMRPIRDLFERMPRLVFELGRDLGKQARVELEGEWTEVDRAVLEKLSDPLVHLIRNGMDHGLEGPEERVAAGKEPVGTLLLSASHQGGDVVIRVSDDGRGLNAERIQARAVERGLVPENAAMTVEQIHELVFEPGFSTAAAVTDVSGRGVGMDVVRQNVEALSGRIAVHSVLGQGATFEIVLPLTLAILDGQLLSAGGEAFILPMRSMVECLRPDAKRYVHVHGHGRSYTLRGEHLPVVRLGAAFGLPSDAEEHLLVVVEAAGHRVALEVEAMGAQRQFVLKSLDRNYQSIPGLAGATVLTDGRLAMVLDATALVTTDLSDVRERISEAESTLDGGECGDAPEVGSTLVTVRSGDAVFALPANRVAEIRVWNGATVLPFSRAGVLGGVNKGGEVVPVWDARRLLARGTARGTDAAARVVVAYLQAWNKGDKPRLLGLVLDEVLDVVAHDPSNLTTKDLPPLLLGLIPSDGSVIGLIDVDRIGA